MTILDLDAPAASVTEVAREHLPQRPRSTVDLADELLGAIARGDEPKVRLIAAELAGLSAARTVAPGSVFEELKTLAELGIDMDVEPPDPRWSWTRTDEDDGLERGVVERGVVGMLVGMPGIGKSTLSLAAAVSVASGCNWLDWHPAETGRVLFATAEETRVQVLRRLYRLTRPLSPKQRLMVRDRLTVWPLRGEMVALVHGERDDYHPTDFALALRERLSIEEHALILVDPLSRFAGPDTETNNAAGTAFVRELEALTLGRGEPTVLFAHHTRKDGERGDMYAARGSSSLSGAVKWQANVEGLVDERQRPWGLEVIATKSNYAARPPRASLRWESDGMLRPATKRELLELRAQIAGARKKAAAAKREAAKP